MRHMVINGYYKGKTLDRIDNNGNYSPQNCRYTIKAIQDMNKRTNIKITAWGETKIAKYWALDPRVKVCLATFVKNIRLGWPPEKALTEKQIPSNHCVIEAFGERKTVTDWAKDSRCVVSENILRKRLKKNWFPEYALVRKYTRKRTKWHKKKISRETAKQICIEYTTTEITMLDLAYKNNISEGVLGKILNGSYYEGIGKTFV